MSSCMRYPRLRPAFENICNGYGFPKLYRYINLSQVDVYFRFDQLHLIPAIVTKLLQLKNIALETVVKAETSIIEVMESRRRRQPMPPHHGSQMTRTGCLVKERRYLAIANLLFDTCGIIYCEVWS
ncbi:hypothetical protein RMATCC62417_13459 [Rhizopus microsporus]|nr:hypothetical protein RMATCC62417_13459 [Rhizopus microsporus]